VAAFEMLWRMRMEEEGLAAAAAADAVLRENLFGLELDPRCTQIAAFALALAAWKVGGYRPLPLPNVACSGIPVQGQLETWTRLAGDDVALRTALERLYALFKNAPDLGSLINPADVPLNQRMFTPDYAQVEPVLEKALGKERSREDPTAAIFGAAAEGVARAARLLAGTYTLVATNVPYLARTKQADALKEFCDRHYPDAKADLAAAFVERCRAFASTGGSYALVTPQNWLFLGSYRHLRERVLQQQEWHHACWLGPGAFEMIGGEVVKPALLILSNLSPRPKQTMAGIDTSGTTSSKEKARLLRDAPLQITDQASQLQNPDARIALTASSREVLLGKYADSYQGICTGDYPRFGRCFWEMPHLLAGWILQQSTIKATKYVDGCEHVLLWQNGSGELHACLEQRLGETGLGAWVRGLEAWGKRGICVSQMGDLPASLYNGDCFDNNAAVIIPKDKSHLPAIWAFCKSPAFARAVRRIDKALKVTNKTLLKVPFDLSYWQKVSADAGPLPEPCSNDPTQWLFGGQPAGATEPLQVAVARLLGYRWPQQKPDALADQDGILCLPPVAGEPPAAQRLLALLAAAYGQAWSPAQQERLLAAVGYGGKGLDEWLRDGFFAQHCKLFHNRPFIWHIWDGRKDGFATLVNYHKLDMACLNRLIYTYLGAWINYQRAERDAGVAGADGRLVAALELQKKLELIRDGEKPYDIYVRWKPLERQPIGWEPDLNDGLRLNIRPFVTAGVLRCRFTINWNKDRGRNPDDTERLNDRHYTVAEKQAARQAVGQPPTNTHKR
jgi:hypothetical protein